MKNLLSRMPARMALAGLALSAVPGASVQAAPPDDPVRITLTSDDVAATNEKAQMAVNALVAMWTSEFRGMGQRFVAPRVVRHRSGVRSACGVIPARNASYCYGNNTIYFDDLFLAAQAKLTGLALGSDGDMAAVGILAHEMGHAAAFQLGARSRRSYANESIADCFTGVFARHARADGSLEAGDLEEAFYAMAAAADPELQPTGDRRVDAQLASRLRRSAHGTREQRQQNFRNGYERGGGACIASFNKVA